MWTSLRVALAGTAPLETDVPHGPIRVARFPEAGTNAISEPPIPSPNSAQEIAQQNGTASECLSVRHHGVTKCSSNEGRSSSGGHTMTFVSSASGRACLNDWHKALSVSDLLTLLTNLKRMLAVAGSPVILIIVIREAVPVPANDLLTCIRATLPAILAYCEELAVAVEGTSANHALFRASFQSAGAGSARHTSTHLFDTLSAAFAHTQRRAPHDVLELQRHTLLRDLSATGN